MRLVIGKKQARIYFSGKPTTQPSAFGPSQRPFPPTFMNGRFAGPTQLGRADGTFSLGSGNRSIPQPCGCARKSHYGAMQETGASHTPACTWLGRVRREFSPLAQPGHARRLSRTVQRTIGPTVGRLMRWGLLSCFARGGFRPRWTSPQKHHQALREPSAAGICPRRQPLPFPGLSFVFSRRSDRWAGLAGKPASRHRLCRMLPGPDRRRQLSHDIREEGWG